MVRVVLASGRVAAIGIEPLAQRRVLPERHGIGWARLDTAYPPIRAIDILAADGDSPARQAREQAYHCARILLSVRPRIQHHLWCKALERADKLGKVASIPQDLVHLVRQISHPLAAVKE